MSANDSALENWIAQSLERRAQVGSQNTHQDKQTAPKAAGIPLNNTDRMIALIEAAAATFDPNDPGAVQTVFAGQAVALDVIFKDFIKRRSYTFENMRVALRAQAQCRSTFKTLTEFQNPRPRPSPQISRNSNEQTIENAKTPA